MLIIDKSIPRAQVPGFFSNNPVCPSFGVPRTVNQSNQLHVFVCLIMIYFGMVQAIRPQRLLINVIVGFCGLLYYNGVYYTHTHTHTHTQHI